MWGFKYGYSGPSSYQSVEYSPHLFKVTWLSIVSMINQWSTDLEVIRKLVVEDEEDVAYAESDDPVVYGEAPMDSEEEDW